MHTSFEIKKDMEIRVKNLLSGTETVSQFCYKSMEERVKRMEARSERAKLQQAEKDKTILEPIVKALLEDFGLIK